MNTNCNCPFPATDLYLSRDEVHIWCACLNQSDSYIGQIAQTLSSDELKRAKKFHFLQHRDEFIVAHGLLRKLLANYTDIHAGGITFNYGKDGKPFLSKNPSGEKVRFNLSYSDGYALFAFAYDQEIGVDLECIRDFTEMEKVAEQVFSTKEIAVLWSFPKAEKKEAFFTLWTRKEAYKGYWRRLFFRSRYY